MAGEDRGVVMDGALLSSLSWPGQKEPFWDEGIQIYFWRLVDFFEEKGRWEGKQVILCNLRLWDVEVNTRDRGWKKTIHEERWLRSDMVGRRRSSNERAAKKKDSPSASHY